MAIENLIKILALGDVVGSPGRLLLRQKISELRAAYAPDLLIVNIENSAGGFGPTPAIADELKGFGIDLMTVGDHAWDRKELKPYLDENSAFCIRPGNYPQGAPGRGYTIVERLGKKIGLMILQGRVFIGGALDCPFKKADEYLAGPLKECDFKICEFHAEATSEKVAMGNYLDGRVSFVYGTHTHVATADMRLLPKGTAYVTDLGMCGPLDSVIGMKKEIAIDRFLSGLPHSYDVAKVDAQLNGVLATIDAATGKGVEIRRI